MQNHPILVVGMELWKSLGHTVTSKITFVLLRLVTSNPTQSFSEGENC